MMRVGLQSTADLTSYGETSGAALPGLPARTQGGDTIVSGPLADSDGSLNFLCTPSLYHTS